MQKVPMQATLNWDKAAVLPVEQYSWGGTYRPKTTAEILLVEQSGLFVRLTCEETNPRVTYHGPDLLVCQDSCLECFLNLAPEQSEEYLNLESNAAGSLYASFGAERNHRRFLREMNVPMPTVQVEQTADGWSVTYGIPLALVEKLYPGKTLQSGDCIRGNFYKCGDLTEVEHYGSWQPIEAPAPDFHRPEFFGSLQLWQGEGDV